MKRYWILSLLSLLLAWNCQQQNPGSKVEGNGKFTLVYYAIPKCSNCARIQATLESIQKRYPQTFHLIVLSTASEEGKADLQMYRLGSHGLLIFNNDQLLKAVPGHFLTDSYIHQLLDSIRLTLPMEAQR